MEGNSGGDRLLPGPGRDVVRGGDGNDTIVIQDICEIVSGETLDGGAGSDSLYSPLSLSQLVAAGVTVRSIETIHVFEGRTDMCAAFDPTLEIVELTGTVVASDVLWHDSTSDRWFAPDGNEHAASIWTRYVVDVDGSYSPLVAAGEQVFVLASGGEMVLPGGIGVVEEHCCTDEPRLGFRYRMRLRQVRDGVGSIVGFELDQSASSVFGDRALLWLRGGGPILESLENPGNEAPQGYSPELRSHTRI
jgi:hypothetical protein